MNIILILGTALLGLALLGAALLLFALLIKRRVEAAVPPLGRFVQVGETRLHIVERGAGPTLVLIHGLGTQLRNFHALLPLLAANFRVVCVDRPGCGYSTRPARVSASLPGQADTIAKLMASLGLEKPIIVGHSYGGAVALALALHHPERVGGLALLAPLTHAQDAAPAAFRDLVIASPRLRRLISWTVAPPVSMVAGAKILDLVFRPDAVPADFATAAGGLLALRPSQYFAASSDLVAARDDLPGLEARYSSIRVPVGIRFGLNDQILSHEDHGVAMQSKIQGVALSLVDGGHMLPIVAPQETARWIAEFAREASNWAEGQGSRTA
jgi:pimeloyl-ACP methyl ester carboxylesterase